MGNSEELICTTEHLTVWTRYCINQYSYNRVQLNFSTERIKVITRAGYVKQKGETFITFR
jgi:hypothetical protein